MLFDGDCLPPHRALGLLWLTLAYENAGREESWIRESYDRAMASASAAPLARGPAMIRSCRRLHSEAEAFGAPKTDTGIQEVRYCRAK
jgi:hypothetical protein